MSVDAKTVERIAHLARLKLGGNEAASMETELNKILGFVEQLQAVDTEGVEPATSVIPNTLRWRADEVKDGDRRDEVLANAPDAQFGFFAVPKVIE